MVLRVLAEAELADAYETTSASAGPGVLVVVGEANLPPIRRSGVRPGTSASTAASTFASIAPAPVILLVAVAVAAVTVSSSSSVVAASSASRGLASSVSSTSSSSSVLLAPLLAAVSFVADIPIVPAVSIWHVPCL